MVKCWWLQLVAMLHCWQLSSQPLNSSKELGLLQLLASQLPFLSKVKSKAILASLWQHAPLMLLPLYMTLVHAHSNIFPLLPHFASMPLSGERRTPGEAISSVQSQPAACWKDFCSSSTVVAFSLLWPWHSSEGPSHYALKTSRLRISRADFQQFQ